MERWIRVQRRAHNSMHKHIYIRLYKYTNNTYLYQNILACNLNKILDFRVTHLLTNAELFWSWFTPCLKWYADDPRDKNADLCFDFHLNLYAVLPNCFLWPKCLDAGASWCNFFDFAKVEYADVLLNLQTSFDFEMKVSLIVEEEEYAVLIFDLRSWWFSFD